MCKCVRINPINIQPSQVTLVQRCWISGFDQQGNVKEIFSSTLVEEWIYHLKFQPNKAQFRYTKTNTRILLTKNKHKMSSDPLKYLP